MKIIEWNCQGAFRNKYERIMALEPDILIVPECESKHKFGDIIPEPSDFFWYGDSFYSSSGLWTIKRALKKAILVRFGWL
jgi:hypothetical protein